MKTYKDIFILLIGGMAIFALFSCASTGNDSASLNLQNQESKKLSRLNFEMEKKNNELASLRSNLDQKDKTIQGYMLQLDKAKAKSQAMSTQNMEAKTSSDIALLPPAAKINECYARVFVPPVYKTSTEQLLKKGASERLEVIPAEFEWVKEQILVKEASSKLEIVPAKYAWVEEKVLVNPAYAKMQEIPAKYEMVSEKILIKPAHTVWKKGRGLIEKVNNTTGEIMCLIEIPASYRTVNKRVMTSPPQTSSVMIPEKYNTVKKRVMVTPPTTRVIEIPASFKTVKVKKIISPAQERRVAIPEEYQTVSKTELVTDGSMEWRRVMCETNVSPNVISKLQTALLKSGHDPGPIDGILGSNSRSALKSYQKEKGLAMGELTYNTLNSLGIKLGR